MRHSASMDEKHSEHQATGIEIWLLQACLILEAYNLVHRYQHVHKYTIPCLKSIDKLVYVFDTLLHQVSSTSITWSDIIIYQCVIVQWLPGPRLNIKTVRVRVRVRKFYL